MSYFARLRGSNSARRRLPPVRSMLEPLEPRIALSAAAPSPHVPTTTALAVSQTSIETAQQVTFVATVENANHPVPVTTGKVKFVIQSPTKKVLDTIQLNKHGEAGITTSDLDKVGVYQVTAQYIPSGSGFAASTASSVQVNASPLSVSSFLITPQTRMGHLGAPITVTVTALDAHKQPVTNYTGTIVFSSSTDSWTTFPTSIYKSLHIAPPSPDTQGLASFAIPSYTFKPTDHGTHTFTNLVVFGKGGAETIKVAQANNPKVSTKTTVAIA